MPSKFHLFFIFSTNPQRNLTTLQQDAISASVQEVGLAKVYDEQETNG
jgi:hypothetical protein